MDKHSEKGEVQGSESSVNGPLSEPKTDHVLHIESDPEEDPTVGPKE